MQSVLKQLNKKSVRVVLSALLAAVAVLAHRYPALEGIVALLAAAGIKPPHLD